jgi:hypothetical protein
MSPGSTLRSREKATGLHIGPCLPIRCEVTSHREAKPTVDGTGDTVPPASLQLSTVHSPWPLRSQPGAIAEPEPQDCARSIRPSVGAPASKKQELRSSDFKYPSRLPYRAALPLL